MVTVSAGRDYRTGRYKQVNRTVNGGIRAAKALAAELEATVHSGQQRSTTGTVSSLLDAYIEHKAATNRAAKTLEGYETIARSIKASPLGAVRLRALGPADLDAYYRYCTARGIAPRTVHHHAALVSQAVNQAIRWRHMDGPNPVDDSSRPAIEEIEPESPPPAEVRAMVEAAELDNPDLACLLFVAATTGCRRGEVCAWRWSDFVGDRYAQLVVRRSISDSSAGVAAKTTKTNKVRRMALDEATSAALLTQWGRYMERCEALGVEPSREAYVFSQEADHSEPWRPARVTQTVRRLRLKLDVGPGVKLGLLRHFAATQLLAGGVDIKTASARMGHDGVVMLRRYAGVVAANDEAAAAILGRAVAALSPPLELSES